VTVAAGSTRQEGVSAKRPMWSRVSAGQVVMVVAALTAFVLNINILRSQDEVALVAVAAGDLAVGHIVTESDLSFVEVDASSALVDRLVTDSSAVVGRVVGVEVVAGDPVSPGALRDVAATDDQRAFTIPVDPDHAGGGRLISARDLVDVIAVDDGAARYVVTGATVLDVADVGDRGLVASTDYFLVVAVDADTALALAEALAADSIEIVRSTGAPPPKNLTLTPPEAEADPVAGG